MKTLIRKPGVARTLAILAVFFGSACGGSTVVDTALPIATVDVAPAGGLTLNVGASAQLTATPKGSKGELLTARPVSWQSANNAVATVNAAGQVTAVSAGTVQVTAAAGGITSTPVAVVVNAVPRIGLSATSVNFSGLAGGANPAAQTVTISNAGGGTLSGLSVATTGLPSWLTASLSPTTAPSTLTLQATLGSLAAGTYTAIVPVLSTTAANSPQNVTVTLTVNSAFTLSVAAGGTGSGTVTGGGLTCTITNGVASGTCSVRLAAGTALTLTAAPTGTSVFSGWGGPCSGTSTCALTMTADRAVTATFNPPTPAIVLSSSSISFAGIRGATTNPAPQTVAITNGGSTALTGLTTQIVYAAGQPTGWLRSGLSSQTAPANDTLQATIGSLAAGTYTATVNVLSPVASNSPQPIAVTFVVSAQLPIPVTTLPATNITVNSAILNGSVAQDGLPYTYFFEYGTSPTFTVFTSTPQGANPGSCAGQATCSLSFTLNGLAGKTTYFFRLVGRNGAGDTRGLIVSFTTN